MAEANKLTSKLIPLQGGQGQPGSRIDQDEHEPFSCYPLDLGSVDSEQTLPERSIFATELVRQVLVYPD